jgi:hypothetical protein
MTATEIPVGNGVNVDALLGVRDALASTPEIAQFQWRSTVSWENGAGHCGLAMSRCLAARSVDHVVLQRGEVDASGVLDQRYDEAGDLARARNVPSMRLVGSPGRTVDLNALGSAGVRVQGHALRPRP